MKTLSHNGATTDKGFYDTQLGKSKAAVTLAKILHEEHPQYNRVVSWYLSRVNLFLKEIEIKDERFNMWMYVSLKQNLVNDIEGHLQDVPDEILSFTKNIITGRLRDKFLR